MAGVLWFVLVPLTVEVPVRDDCTTPLTVTVWPVTSAGGSTDSRVRSSRVSSTGRARLERRPLRRRSSLALRDQSTPARRERELNFMGANLRGAGEAGPVVGQAAPGI